MVRLRSTFTGICRDGGIGRRAGLKIPWWQHRVGSIPTLGTPHKICEKKLS